MSGVALLLIGDGRDRLRTDTLASFYENVLGDTPSFIVEVDDREHLLGFAGAIRKGWEQLRQAPGWDFVFHLEEDWQFDRPFRIDRMIDLLECDRRLAQVALRRGPVNAQEERAGGVVEAWPDEYEDGVLYPGNQGELDLGLDPVECPFLRHSLYFTTNPSVYSRSLIESFDWPDSEGSEAAFTALLRSCNRTFALWGAREGTWVTHTGHVRTGVGY